jgi:hypothetical protein
MKLNTLKTLLDQLVLTGIDFGVVGEWYDSETGTVYNVSGFGGRTSPGQIIKYINMLAEKDSYVRNGLTNSQEFTDFILEQHDGGKSKERGTGFASRFPNGRESMVEFEIKSLTTPHNREQGAKVYKESKKAASTKCRVELTFLAKTTGTIKMSKMTSDVVVDADMASSIRYLKKAI